MLLDDLPAVVALEPLPDFRAGPRTSGSTVTAAGLSRQGAPVLDDRIVANVPPSRPANRPRCRIAVLRKDGGTYCVHGVGVYFGVVLLDGLTTSDSRRDSPLDDRLQQANTGVFIVYTDSHLLDESPFRPSNADRSFIVKISRMFDALR